MSDQQYTNESSHQSIYSSYESEAGYGSTKSPVELLCSEESYPFEMLEEEKVADQQVEQQAVDNSELTDPKHLFIDYKTPIHELKANFIIFTVPDLAKAYGRLAAMAFNNQHEHQNNSQYDDEYSEKWRKLGYELDAKERRYSKYSKDFIDEPIAIEELDEFKKGISSIKSLASKTYAFYHEQEQYKKKLRKLKKDAEEAAIIAKNLMRLKFFGVLKEETNGALLWLAAGSLTSLVDTITNELNMPYKEIAKLSSQAVTIANLVLNWAEDTPMTKGSNMAAITELNQVMGVAGAAVSLVGGKYNIVFAYIGPMLSTITKLLGQIQLQYIQQNDDWVKLDGKPLYYNHEPGGKEMWNFMVGTMSAKYPSDMPLMNDKVLEYFSDFEDEFEEFDQERYDAESDNGKKLGPLKAEEFKKNFLSIDKRQLKTWIFRRREMVWAMLYGSRDYKEARTISK